MRRIPRFANRTIGRHPVTLATSRPREGSLTTAALATTFDHGRPLVVPGALHRAAAIIADLLGAAGVLLCVPFVILAIGIPIALCLRFLLWIAGLL